MKRFILLLCIALIPIGVIIMVNESSPDYTHSKKNNQCTRYCHDHGCPHFLARQSESEVSERIVMLYKANIDWLKNNPFGLSYQEMNLLLYVFFSPLLLLGLLWGIIRKTNE